MEKYIVWYKLWIKLFCKKKIYWVQLIGIAAILLIISSITIPKGKNLFVGIYRDGGKYSKQIMENLLNEGSIFQFVEYTDKNQLYEDVLEGSLECGFVFDSNLDERIEKGNLKKSITYLENSFSVKGKTVQETVYASLFKIYSDEILKQNIGEIYGNLTEDKIVKLIEINHKYQNSDAVFQMEIKTKNMPYKTKETDNNLFDEIKPLKGMVGIFVFFVMFMAYGSKYEESNKRIEKSLTLFNRFIYSCTKQIAAGSIPAILGIFAIHYLGAASNIVEEFVRIIIFLFLSSVWITTVGKFIKNGYAFAGTIISMLLINLLVCPIYINFENYIPAISYIRYIFPLGWYLI